jgi:hypothetical protein
LTYGVSNRGILIRNIVFGLDVGVRAGQNRPTIEANSRFRPSGVRPVMTNRFRWQVRASRSKECGHDSIVTGRNQDAGITSCKPCMTTHWKSFVYIVRIVHGRRYFESVRFIAGRLYEVSVKSESALRQCIGVPINMGTVYSVIVPSLGLSLVEICPPCHSRQSVKFSIRDPA